MRIPQRAGRNCHWLASQITSCASPPKKQICDGKFYPQSSSLSSKSGARYATPIFCLRPCTSDSPSLTWMKSHRLLFCQYVNVNMLSSFSPCCHVLFSHVLSDPYLANSDIGHLPWSELSSISIFAITTALCTRLWEQVRLPACTELSLSTVQMA